MRLQLHLVPGKHAAHRRWTASDPGDNIRVITAGIPEPASWAMPIAGFGMVGFAARRR